MAVGASAVATGSQSVVVGANAQISSGTASDAVAVGYQASAGAAGVSGSIAIGRQASATQNGAIALGYGTATSAANQFMAGSSTQSVTSVVFGNGNTSATPAGFSIRGTTATGTNTAGVSITLIAPLGTGTGTPGTLIVQAAPVTTTGTTTQTAATVATFSNGGALSGSANTGSVLALTQSATTTGGPLNALAITSTWNNANSTFGGITLSGTQAASGASSTLIQLGIGDTSGGASYPHFQVGRTGQTRIVSTNNSTTGVPNTTMLADIGGSLQTINDASSASASAVLFAAGTSCSLGFIRARGTAASPTRADLGDVTGNLLYAVWDPGNTGAAFSTAWIFGQIDGSTGTNDYPGRLTIGTTKDGSNSPTSHWAFLAGSTNTAAQDAVTGAFVGASTRAIGWAAGSTLDTATGMDTNISRQAAGIVQVGTTVQGTAGAIRMSRSVVAQATSVGVTSAQSNVVFTNEGAGSKPNRG